MKFPAATSALPRTLLAALLVLSLTPACQDDSGNAAKPDIEDARDATSPTDAPEPGDTAHDTQDDAHDSSGNEPLWPPVATSPEEAFALADPFFGSGGLGFSYGGGTPAAQLPLGLVRLGPDTNENGIAAAILHTSGYYAGDTHTWGFSHLHFVGTGVEDYGNLRVLPTSSDLEPWARPGWVRIDPTSEDAQPGYYRVTLPDDAVDAEFTATTWAGIHRYTARRPTTLHLYWDSSAAIASTPERFGQIDTRKTSAGAIEGRIEYGGPYTGRGGLWSMNFVARCDRTPDAIQLWDADGYRDADSVHGWRSGARLTFTLQADESVELRVGLGPVDAAQAHAHLDAIQDASFQDLREAAKQAWLEKLARIQVAGATPQTREIFYSAMYRLWQMPTLWQGMDARYISLDKQEGQTDPGARYLTDLSLWDTFRTLHPLYELIDPDTQRDVLNSLLIMARAGGSMPRWPAASSYTGGMIGSSADHLFASSALKGIDGVDYDQALDLSLVHAQNLRPPPSPGVERNGIEDYLTLGYVADDHHGHSVSSTLEFAWADASLANLAHHLGREADETSLRAQSKNWQNLFHPELRFLRPRLADGTWNPLPSATSINMSSGAYTEGSAWHYRFYVMHDLPGLIQAWGDDDDFLTQLEALFAGSNRLRRDDPADALLPESYYWHSNEPVIDAVYVFHHLGRYDRLTHWLRRIQRSVYTTGPTGLPGNDDGGTMSAWYVFNALGLYPVVGTDQYYVGMPLFPWSKLQLDNGATLTIEAPGLTDNSTRVREVLRNGQPIDGFTIRHADLRNATLRFVVE